MFAADRDKSDVFPFIKVMTVNFQIIIRSMAKIENFLSVYYINQESNDINFDLPPYG